MITAAAFNERVREAARHQRLGGTISGGRGRPSEHHWPVQVALDEREITTNPLTGQAYFSASVFQGAAERQMLRVFVGPGTVNDRMAAITYLRTNDPRGWEMPLEYPRAAEMRRIYGDDFALVDRLLTERAAPPHLLLELPSLDPSDTGDFERVADTDRRQPAAFRTRAMWELELYRASVFVTAQPARYMRVETRAHFPLPSRNTRFRVAAAPHLPPRIAGTALGQRELARLYLTRMPGRSFQVSDLYVQQRCFWSLWTATTYPGLALLEATAEAAELVNLAILPLGVGGLALGTTLLAGEALLADILLSEIAADFEAAASVEFWSAA